MSYVPNITLVANGIGIGDDLYLWGRTRMDNFLWNRDSYYHKLISIRLKRYPECKCLEVVLTQPVTGKEITVRAPVPRDFEDVALYITQTTDFTIPK